MTKPLEVEDVNTLRKYIVGGEPENPIFRGDVAVQYEKNEQGLLRDANGNLQIATSAKGKRKIGPIIMEWRDKGIRIGDKCFGAWFAAGGGFDSRAFPHGHTGNDDGGYIDHTGGAGL